MATHVAKASGTSESNNLAILLRKKEPPGTVSVRRHAPVTPAIQRERNIIPAKAVDEWPDGKDRRPSRTESSFLSCEI